MSHSLTFRFAEVADFAAVLELAFQLATHIEADAPPLTAAQFKRYYVTPDAPMHLLLAVYENRIVGMISWTLTHELYSADTRVYISDLSVDRAARGQGIGTALLAEVMVWARAQGASKLGWEVWHRNSSAKAFYERLGASIDQEAIPYVLVLADLISSFSHTRRQSPLFHFGWTIAFSQNAIGIRSSRSYPLRLHPAGHPALRSERHLDSPTQSGTRTTSPRRHPTHRTPQTQSPAFAIQTHPAPSGTLVDWVVCVHKVLFNWGDPGICAALVFAAPSCSRSL